MTLFEAILMSPLLHALGWALLHFIWQGALVALLLAGILTLLLRGSSPHTRYSVSCAALLLMLILPAVTFWKMSYASHGAEVDEMRLQTGPRLDVSAAQGRAEQLGERNREPYAGTAYDSGQRQLAERLDSFLPWMIMAWLLGVLALSARVGCGLIYTRRLVRLENRQIESHWQERLLILSRRLRLSRSIRLLESGLVRVPTTIGWLRPVILLPTSALTGLTPQQLESILAHELAHIRRHDYLVNLFQVVIETLLFYHPAVWWVSRRVRIEREQACDDLAVAVCGDPLDYARALAKIERLRKGAPALALAASGGKLSGRIHRLIEGSHGARRSSSTVMGLLFVAAFFTSLAFAHTAFSHKKQVTAAGPESKVRASRATDEDTAEGEASERSAPAREIQSLIASDETAGEDAEVRRVALKALGDRAGAVIVMDPRTGRVYTIVNQEWAVRRSWKPASTIKLVTAAAGVSDRTIEPAERVRVSTQPKPLDLTEALAISDNSYFGYVGQSVGTERLIKYARELGLGEQTGINHDGESAGSLPLSLAGADASRIGAFGEGIEATPIQLAILVSAIANGGSLVVPRVPRTPEEGERFEPQIRRRTLIPRKNLGHLIPGMISAVNFGTARAASDPAQRIAGKTGTFVDDEASVGLFASYAPADDPRLVVVVVTRGRNESGPVAASVAGTIYRALYHRS